MYKKESGFGHKIHKSLKSLRLSGANYLSFLIEHISLNKINNNHFEEIRDSFPKYFENRKQANLKLLYFQIFLWIFAKKKKNK